MKEYLGDGVYVQLELDRVILTTEDGISTTNTVVLEIETLLAFQAFIKRNEEAL